MRISRSKRSIDFQSKSMEGLQNGVLHIYNARASKKRLLILGVRAAFLRETIAGSGKGIRQD